MAFFLDGDDVLVVTDARRRELYWARYRDGIRFEGPAVNAPADVPWEGANAVAGSADHAAMFPLPRLDAEQPTPVGLVRAVDWTADPGPLVTMWLAEEQRAEAARTRKHGLFEPLTARELTILRMLPAPGSLRELAADLYVAPSTMKTHLRAIYRKLGAESRQEAVIRAREGGLI